MDEKNFKTERTPSDKGLPKIGLSFEQELQHLGGPFIANICAKETTDLMDKFIQAYKGDPLVDEFDQKYARVVEILTPLLDSPIADPVEKMAAILDHFVQDPSSAKDIMDFVFVAQLVNEKYKIFDRGSQQERKNNLTAKESGVLEDNVSPLFQWVTKIKLQLEPKASTHEVLFEKSEVIAARFNEGMRTNENLENLFKEKGPNPFRSIFSRKRQEAFKLIESRTINDIADFLIRHKDDHPEYVDAIFRKAKRGDRDFLKEFEAEPDHAALKKLYNAPGVGLKFVDKINKAYRYGMETRLSVEECDKQLSDKAIPKELQIALVAKMEKNHKDGFNMPTTKELSDFVNDLKAALNSPKGLKHADYLKLLNTTPPRSALFGLESHIFENSKVFKARPDRPAPVAPPRVSIAKPVSQVKPQRY
jgi:hypothetical protein